MLIEFSVANYRSFRDRVTLSLRAGADDWLEPGRVTTAQGERLLHSVALYGLNSGGKTNLLRALGAMRRAISQAHPLRAGISELPAQPFVLSYETADAPSEFEVVLQFEDRRFRYGFQITSKKIRSEWLFQKRQDGTEFSLFTRQGLHIEVTPAFAEGVEIVKNHTREEVLFLVAVAGWNGATAGQIVTQLRKVRTLVEPRSSEFLLSTASRLKDDAELRVQIRQLASAAKLGFIDLWVLSEDDPAKSNGPSRSSYLRPRVQTLHPIYRDGAEGAENKLDDMRVFDLLRDESAGTSKFVSMAVPFLLALRQGSLLVVDELEARMHPALTRQLLDLFHGPLNTKGAQLIFATHDTHLLDPARIRRDQVYFVDKDERGASTLTRMSEYDTPEGADYERLYLLGMFGATPGAPDFTQALRNGRAG